eukprot:CAMPEP_0195292778 /NCGR_PEP_ID=MMETSP0707-20130614/10832_1 /TAXON_ID=33640 /ORGANISM="Asterionellopsis glacialis, Strain CCMP134" /LENGTH=172 /DNA_ID=CAMNT_0040353345 /DNA_START=71 /DNA_END=589 /DNA_ORIENTATION=+
MEETLKIYQVDYSVTTLGDGKEESTKEISWRYGYETDPCSVEEHEIVFTWSFRSGKQLVTLDGKEVHYSERSGASVFDFKFCTDDPHDIQVICTRTPPNNSPAHFRCYELLVNGKSFHNYPKPGEDLANVQDLETSDTGPCSIVDILYPQKTAFQEKDDFVVVYEPASPSRA